MVFANNALAGRTAVVTGSSSGIGRAAVLALAAAGADCLVHARRSGPAAEALADEIRVLGRHATVILCDLGQHGSHQPFVEQAWNWRGAVDIWVNNAGADVLTGEAAKWPFERKLEVLWNVDVAAAVHLSRDVGARMKARGSGVILNIGWDQAAEGMAGDSGELFAATKGAVMAFTRSLAQSLAPDVRVNCVAPGWIKTKWGDGASDYWNDRAVRESLLGRWGSPEDVAAMLCFLASEQASFITGQVIAVNGGRNRA